MSTIKFETKAVDRVQLSAVEIEQFVNYCLEFYGPTGIYDYGMTREEVLLGLAIVLNTRTDLEFAGDSVDREHVRDAVLRTRELVLD